MGSTVCVPFLFHFFSLLVFEPFINHFGMAITFWWSAFLYHFLMSCCRCIFRWSGDICTRGWLVPPLLLTYPNLLFLITMFHFWYYYMFPFPTWKQYCISVTSKNPIGDSWNERYMKCVCLTNMLNISYHQSGTSFVTLFQ